MEWPSTAREIHMPLGLTLGDGATRALPWCVSDDAWDIDGRETTQRGELYGRGSQ